MLFRDFDVKTDISIFSKNAFSCYKFQKKTFNKKPDREKKNA